MNPWDYVAGTMLGLAAAFLSIHAVMVGNPQYGWQPRSPVVRLAMGALAALMAARAYTVLALGDDMSTVGRFVCAALMALFLLQWLDMMIASWRARGVEDLAHTLETIVDRVVAPAHAATAAAKEGAAVSRRNTRRLDLLLDIARDVRRILQILEPIPHGPVASEEPRKLPAPEPRP